MGKGLLPLGCEWRGIVRRVLDHGTGLSAVAFGGRVGWEFQGKLGDRKTYFEV